MREKNIAPQLTAVVQNNAVSRGVWVNVQATICFSQGIWNINDGQISRLVNVDNWDSSICPGNLRMARFGFREMNALNSSSETDLRGIWWLFFINCEDVIKGESGDDDDVCVGGWCLRRKSERWEINDVDYVEPPVSLKLELIQVGKTIQS